MQGISQIVTKGFKWVGGDRGRHSVFKPFLSSLETSAIHAEESEHKVCIHKLYTQKNNVLQLGVKLMAHTSNTESTQLQNFSLKDQKQFYNSIMHPYCSEEVFLIWFGF